MTEVDDNPDLTKGYGVTGDTSLQDYPKTVQVAAIGKAIKMLTEEGYSPFDVNEVSEALGPPQLKLLAQKMELSEEECQTIAKNLPADHLEAIVSRQLTDSEIMESPEQTGLMATIGQVVLEQPEPVFYGFSIGIMMVALYLTSPLAALAGTALFVGTALHYNASE